MNGLENLRDATNIQAIRCRLSEAATRASERLNGDQTLDEIDRMADEIYAEFLSLADCAAQDYWHELGVATPGVLPEEVEGHASNDSYEVFVGGKPTTRGTLYSVDVLERLI